MDLGLKDKSVVVLASSSGLGKAIATEFAREGAQVMLFSRSEEGLTNAQAEIHDATGNKPSFCVGDILNKDNIEGVVYAANKQFGSLYALVNNTGGPPAGPFEKFSDADWNNAFELTLLSYIRAIRVALPLMEAGGGGRILNNTSSSIKNVIDNLLMSNVFRMGIQGLSKTIAREFGPKGILVNTIGAGKIGTDRVDHLDSIKAEKQGVSLEDAQKQFRKQIPLGRYGTPDELARIAVFLCSEANTFVTGQSLLVDGGMVKSY